MSFSGHCIWRYMVSICPNISDVDLDHLDEVMSARYLPWKVKMYFMRITWRSEKSDFTHCSWRQLILSVFLDLTDGNTFQLAPFSFEMTSYSLSMSLIFSRWYHRIILYTYCSKPGISLFSKQPWLFSKG